jgi:hypothetical protein
MSNTQCLEPLGHGLQVVAQPHAAYAGRRDGKPALPQLIGDADLAERRLFDGQRDDGILDILRHAVLQPFCVIGPEKEEGKFLYCSDISFKMSPLSWACTNSARRPQTNAH